MNLRLIVPVLAGGLVLVSCDATPQAGGSAAGQRELDYQIDQEISEERVGEAAAFGRISGLARDAQGRLYVADDQNRQVRVFSADGDPLFAIGRQGAGPGELSNPCCIAFDASGQLWVRDGGNVRYSVYAVGDTGATFLRQVRMAHTDANRFVAVTFDSAGQVIDIGGRTDSAGVLQTHRFTLTMDGAIARDVMVPAVPAESLAVKTITREIPNGRATMYFYQPHGPQQLVAHGPNGEWAHGLSSRYTIEWRAHDGSVIRTLNGDIQRGPELSADERRTAQERLDGDSKRAGQATGFSIPSHKPPLRRLFFDQAGRLWVELSVPENAPRRAHVYDRMGQRVMIAQWPLHIALSEGVVSGDTAWGVAIDSLGVQSVARVVPR